MRSPEGIRAAVGLPAGAPGERCRDPFSMARGPPFRPGSQYTEAQGINWGETLPARVRRKLVLAGRRTKGMKALGAFGPSRDPPSVDRARVRCPPGPLTKVRR